MNTALIIIGLAMFIFIAIFTLKLSKEKNSTRRTCKDYRENHLEDVIMKLDSRLFKKVTGLEISDFELLVNKGVFNKPLMNLAIKDFKTYEDSSLQYLGLTTHKFERYGLMDTVVSKNDLKVLFENKTK